MGMDEIKGRLARRLIVAILLVSSAVALLTTSVQLWLEYRRDIATIDGRFAEIEDSYLESVVQNVWLADRNRLQLVLQGISRLPDFRYAAVAAEGMDVSAGTPPRPEDMRRVYPLRFEHRGELLPIGWLTVAASTEAVLERLIERVWTVLATNAVKTALVAGLMFLLVEAIVTRRVVRLAEAARRIGGGDLETPLETLDTGQDELRELGGTIDEMRRRLWESDRELRQMLLERTAALEQSRQQQRELAMAASVFATTLEGIVITDPAGVILSVNAAFTVLTGWSRDEAVGKHTRILKSDYQDDAFYREMWRQLADGGRWQGELWNRRKDGTVLLVWETITTIFDDDGRPERRIAILSDITELRRQEEKIRYQSHYDGLTGLPNRILLRERLEQALGFAAHSGETVAVLVLDVDRFKLVNDSLGHDVGDNLLKQVAKRLSLAVPHDAVIARLGGDEFAVLLRGLDDSGVAAHVAEELVARLKEPFLVDSHSVHLGASIGVSVFPDDGEHPSVLLSNADAAMYRAKEAGRNGFRFYQPGLARRALDRLDREAALRRAVDGGEFVLHYQPKVVIADGSLSGVEALIRWRDPARGLVPPGEFIPLAEETGLIGPIGEWALREACRQIAAWDAAGCAVPSVAVNVSARQLADPALAETLCGIVEVSGVAPQRLEIELTESVLMTRPDQAQRMLGSLNEAGVAVSIDDFGTGYSSLSYLKQLPIRTLKIDRSFIREIGTDPRDQAIVEAVVAMARSLNFQVVAEGVETVEQLSFLASRGCDFAQGFHFAKPLPPAELAAWVRERTAVAAV